jgi:hypothetical protein
MQFDQLAPAADVAQEADEDDTLILLLMCFHPALTPPSAIALTLRAVGGLTTVEIVLVPEATIAQRISRAKQSIKASGVPFRSPNQPRSGRTAPLCAARVVPDLQRRLHRIKRYGMGRKSPRASPLSQSALDRMDWRVPVTGCDRRRDDEAARAEDTDWPQILALYDLLKRMSDNPMVGAESRHRRSHGTRPTGTRAAERAPSRPTTGRPSSPGCSSCPFAGNGRRPSSRDCTLSNRCGADDEPAGTELPHHASGPAEAEHDKPGSGRFRVVIRVWVILYPCNRSHPSKLVCCSITFIFPD